MNGIGLLAVLGEVEADDLVIPGYPEPDQLVNHFVENECHHDRIGDAGAGYECLGQEQFRISEKEAVRARIVDGCLCKEAGRKDTDQASDPVDTECIELIVVAGRGLYLHDKNVAENACQHADENGGHGRHESACPAL